MAEIQRDAAVMNDWNQSGKASDFLDIFKDWKFDWLDVPSLIANAEQILEYPMVDKDPVSQWTFGRITFMGDAAHPMYPRGSNGSAQALIDARTLADELSKTSDPQVALKSYETLRLAPTAKIVLTNRATPPDFIIMKQTSSVVENRLQTSTTSSVKKSCGRFQSTTNRWLDLRLNR